VWRYDESSSTQVLDGFLALCRFCHEVKHIGLAKVHGRYGAALVHLARVNKWSTRAATKYVDTCFKTYERRSRRAWKQDLTALERWLGCDRKPPL
jgi:hypothetical protein